jgi:ABC-2 type transport system ATP-binding protein
LIATGLEAVRGATAPPPASDLMIQAVHLRKIFGPTSVLDDVSLELGAGHGVTLLGANGTGKTTLLRILATLVRPTGGSLRIAGVDAVKAPDTARGVIARWYGSWVYET